MSNFQMHADARLLVQYLRQVEVGATVTYDTLSGTLSKDIRTARGALLTARRALLREENMVFDTQRGVGLRRLSDAEIVRTAPSFAKRIRRAARRGVATVTAISDFSSLSREDQMLHSASVAIFSATAHMNTDRARAKVEAKLTDPARALPIEDTIAAFAAWKRT